MLINSGSIEITASPIKIRLSRKLGLPYCRCLEFIGPDGNFLKVWIDSINMGLADPREMLKKAIDDSYGEDER